MTVEEIAEIVRGKAQGEKSREIRGVAGLDGAAPSELSFAEGERALSQAAASRAGCILISEGSVLPGHTVITVPHPKLAFISAVEVLLPVEPLTPGVHPTAVVSPEASLAEGARVGPHATIERGVRVGPETDIGAGVFLGEGVQVGSRCVLHPRVTLYPGARLGNHVVLHSGVVVGGDGFGYIFADGRQIKFPQLGGVVIEDDVEIGCNSTVDRGSLGTTVIGEGTKIDNLVQIAHNVRVGRHCVIVAQTGISGGATLGDFVVIGGQAGIGERARIESRAVIGGQAGVLPGKVVPEGAVLWGTPARPFAEFKRLYAHFALLPELARRVKELSRRRRHS